jgi:hypothetical protein
MLSDSKWWFDKEYEESSMLRISKSWAVSTAKYDFIEKLLAAALNEIKNYRFPN